MSLSPEVQRLLHEAAEWRLLGLLFEYPSDPWRANVQSLFDALPRPELRAMAEAALTHSSAGLHIALFGPAGTVPVREVTYQGGVQFGYLMAELSAYYEAFGYSPQTNEAVDHLSVEIGFVSFLKMKRALALMDGDEERAAIAAEAEARFVKEHIAVQAEPVLGRLENFGPDFLIDAGRLIASYAGPAPQSKYPLSAPSGDDDDSEGMCCGTPESGAGDIVQLQP